MKKSIVAATLISALFAVPAIAESTDRLEVQASNLTRFKASEAYKEFKGTYDMNDGSLLSFRKIGFRYYATLDANPPVEIKMTAPNQFSSLSGRTQLKFAVDSKTLNATVVLRKDDGTLVASSGSGATAFN